MEETTLRINDSNNFIEIQLRPLLLPDLGMDGIERLYRRLVSLVCRMLLEEREDKGRIMIILVRVVGDRLRIQRGIDRFLSLLIREEKFLPSFHRLWYSSSVFSPLRIRSTVSLLSPSPLLSPTSNRIEVN